jgi:hypothetical protein
MTKQINLYGDRLLPVSPVDMLPRQFAARFRARGFDLAGASRDSSAELSAAPVCPSSDK